MKRLALAAGLVALGLVGCGASTGTANVPAVASSAEEQQVTEVRGELAESYQTVDALSQKAVVIVRAKVLASAPKTYGQVPFTVATVRIEQVLKGSLSVGQDIDLLQTGGILPLRTPRGTSSPSPVQPQEAAFEGIRVVQPLEEYILFLRPYVGPVTPSAYVVLGEYQGKFKIDGSGIVRFTGSADQLAKPEFATQRAVNGRTTSNVVTEIQRALTK